jgi:hypothetical protein
MPENEFLKSVSKNEADDRLGEFSGWKLYLWIFIEMKRLPNKHNYKPVQ